MFKSSKMLSKTKLFEIISHHSVGQRIIKIQRVDLTLNLANRMNYLLCNPFSTITESTPIDIRLTMTESPELPGWVKFCEKENPTISDSDDFVIPAVAKWAENHKIHDHTTVVEKTVTNDVEKISEILRARYSSPDAVVEALNGCVSVNVSESLVNQLLKRFSSDWIPAFGIFKWAAAQGGVKLSADLYNLMVDILGKSRKFDLMWELVEEMDQLGGYVTLFTMTKVMRRLAKAGRWEDAVQAFQGIDLFGVLKDVSAMNILIDALVKEKSVEKGQEVFMKLKDEIPPNSHTFNVLIHGWCKIRKLDEARKTMEEMEKHGFYPDVISYTCFIEAYCREKDFRKVDGILEEMQEKGCPPNVVTYTIVMHALGKAKETRQALEIYERMKHNGCVPDAAFYSSYIYILSNSGRLKDARNVFEDMLKQGVTPDVWTYNTMITAACEHSEEETALKLLQKMEEASCKPDLKTYAPLLKMCCRKKIMKVLSFLLNHMFKHDISLEVGTYSLLVHGLFKSGMLEHACLFFEEMVLKGLVPKHITYQLLMERLDAKSMKETKEHIKKLMSKAKVQRKNTDQNVSKS